MIAAEEDDPGTLHVSAGRPLLLPSVDLSPASTGHIVAVIVPLL
jgi:hypothetical protein